MINNKCDTLVKNKRKYNSTLRFQNINLIKKFKLCNINKKLYNMFVKRKTKVLDIKTSLWPHFHKMFN